MIAINLFPKWETIRNLTALRQFSRTRLRIVAKQATCDVPAGPNPGDSQTTKYLALDWLLSAKRNCCADRIRAELIRAEAHESNPHFKDDIRQAFIVVSLAAEGHPQPMVEASYRMFGLHPDKVYPAIVARRRAILGSLYDEMMQGSSFPFEFPSRKKPAQSVRDRSARREA
jgi:hypothetical protein